MVMGQSAAPLLSLDAFASRLRHDTYQNQINVTMKNGILNIENVPSLVGEPENQWLMSQFFDAAYKHFGEHTLLGIVLIDESGRTLASNV